MSTPTVFRSSHPDVLAKWDARQRDIADWRDRFHAECAKLGIDPDKVQGNTWSGTITGVTYDDGDPIPEGWRHDKRSGHLRPALKTAAGKRIAAVLKTMRRPEPADDVPGMPYTYWPDDDNRIYRVRMRLNGDVLYAVWPRPVGDDLGVDLALWEPVKLSEFYAMVEAEEAAAPGSPS
ncbi:hypothetical protein AB0C10_37430 [Microbispora amethystogenes]|uniref:hypothetical protein n=1 Tax=Microbispora amethystogenes TaxID=1427754 RepID=UPI0033F59002